MQPLSLTSNTTAHQSTKYLIPTKAAKTEFIRCLAVALHLEFEDGVLDNEELVKRWDANLDKVTLIQQALNYSQVRLS